MNKLLICSMLAVLSGCAKGGGSSEPAAAVACGTKSLYSTWTYPTLIFTFSLANLKLNQNNTATIAFSGGKACTGTVNMTGSECAGTYAITGMAWTGSGGSDPGCASLNESGTYSKADAGLKFVTTGSTNGGTTYQ